MNIIEIAGNLGADPEVRQTGDGRKVISFRMACNKRRKGETKTTWYRVTIWGDRFDNILPYLKKGSAVIVVGELQEPEIYQGKDGQQRVSLDVWAEMIRFSPFGGGNKEGQQGGGFSQAPNPVAPAFEPAPTPAMAGADTSSTLDEDLPF